MEIQQFILIIVNNLISHIFNINVYAIRIALLISYF